MRDELACVESAELGLAARGREAGCLVREAERERDRGRVGVGIHQSDVPAAARELDGEFDRDGGAPGRAGRAPDGDHRRRPWCRAEGVRRPGCGRRGRRDGEPLGELPGFHVQRQGRLQPQCRGDAVVRRPCAQRHDPHRAAVA